MKEIGESLRVARERLGLTLEEVENATRIRTHHLEALERGEHDALPSPVQARGFLKNYADFLGLDAETILLRYAEALQARSRGISTLGRRPEPGVNAAARPRPRRLRWLSFDLFFAAALALLVIALLIWGASRVMESLRDQPDATPAALSFLIPSQTATAQVTETPRTGAPLLPLVRLSPETPLVTQPLVLDVRSGVEIRILAEHRTWLRVSVDGKDAYTGRLAPGEERVFRGESLIEVLTGNGGGLRVIYNGRDQGLLGDLGQVVLRLWTAGGIITPTPTVTRTPEPRTATPTRTEQPAGGSE